MCGIAGIYRFNDIPVSDLDINTLTDALAHRGPDGRGVWFSLNNNVALGHRRLSIIDLSDKAKQPLSYAKERYWISFNGEIYNFLEIRSELISKGYQFITNSDTEVILAAYIEWNDGMLDKFNGMWAIAIYDTIDNILFLSRDRFGVKPLYYYRDNEKLIFASEVQAIHKLLGNKHPLNSIVIDDIIKGKFFNHGTKFTYIENVFNLPGGYNLLIRNNKIDIWEWYKMKQITVPKSFDEQADTLRQLIIDSCKLRLRSDVPVGTCLSGGVDSGSITSIINKLNLDQGTNYNTYTHKSYCASFPDTPIDEATHAIKLADKIGAKLDVVNMNPPLIDDLETAMRQCDGPMHSLAFFPIWKLFRHIRQTGVLVTLDGQGPDEMLGGYQPLLYGLKTAVQLKKPFWFIDLYKTYSAMGENSQFSSKNASKKIMRLFMKTQFKDSLERVSWPVKRVLFKMNLYKFPEFEVGIQNDEFRKPIKINNFIDNALDANLFEQFFQNPLPGILNQYDRCSMANAVECRMPFLDYRIVEFIFSLPPQSKVGNEYTKRILRHAMKNILPDEIRLNKTKIGFNAPIVDWFHNELKDWMLSIMNNPEFMSCKYFNGKEIKNNFEQYISEKKLFWDEAWKFWPPVHFIWWIKENNISVN